MSRNIQSIKPLWPDTLRMPASPPKIIYLDLNHWIRLSKALSSRPDDKNGNEILTACCEGVEKGTAVFPLSSQTYVEILKNGHYRQRCDLGEVIEQISRFMVVMPRHVVATHEVEAVLDRIVGPNPQPINTMDYLDWVCLERSAWIAASALNPSVAKMSLPSFAAGTPMAQRHGMRFSKRRNGSSIVE